MQHRLADMLMLTGVLLLAGCALGDPDWIALYEAKLGQPIRDLNEAALNNPYEDTHGNLTRMTWATLADGSTVLLGLPAYGNRPQQVIDRTVILTQAEWRQHCQRAIGAEAVHGWGWSKASDAVGNSFEVYLQPVPLDPGEIVSIPDPDVPYCEFVFLPEGWELRVVERQGIIKTE
jgi:hypothetical protein